MGQGTTGSDRICRSRKKSLSGPLIDTRNRCLVLSGCLVLSTGNQLHSDVDMAHAASLSTASVIKMPDQARPLDTRKPYVKRANKAAQPPAQHTGSLDYNGLAKLAGS